MCRLTRPVRNTVPERKQRSLNVAPDRMGASVPYPMKKGPDERAPGMAVERKNHRRTMRPSTFGETLPVFAT